MFLGELCAIDVVHHVEITHLIILG
jgi:hypothetical protein